MTEMWHVKCLNKDELNNALRDFLYKYRYIVLDSMFSYKLYYHDNFLYLTNEIMNYYVLGEFFLLPEKLCKTKIAWFKPEVDYVQDFYFYLENEVMRNENRN